MASLPACMLCLRSVDPSENRWRAYEIALRPTLFGDIAVTARWGRIGTGGQERIYHFASQEEALRKVRQLVRRRRQHGYELIEGGRSLRLPGGGRS